MISQACHAVLHVQSHPTYGTYLEEWELSGCTKICLVVDSEEEFNALYSDIETNTNIPIFYITDSGKTEFHGVPTITCMAIGPWDSELLDKYTGRLRLM
jgi:PTH2 family peptidyl-tRNA hydrolase